MRVAALAMLVLAACGGKATAGPDGGSLLKDASATQDALTAPTGPEAGSPACDDAGTCVLCTDDLWHCPGASVFQPCPAGIDYDANCAGAIPARTGNDCFACDSNGGGVDWHCMPEMPGHGAWIPNPMPCMP